MDRSLYRIHWVCIHPDWRVQFGTGTQCVPFSLALRWRDVLNRQFPDMVHWVLPGA